MTMSFMSMVVLCFGCRVMLRLVDEHVVKEFVSFLFLGSLELSLGFWLFFLGNFLRVVTKPQGW